MSLEPSVGCDHHDSRRLEGIVLRKYKLTMVVPACGDGWDE